jgi:hypothetical protein
MTSHPMTQSKTHPELNNSICEAFGCLSQATTKIIVNVGQKGTISLQLCENCVAKFQEEIR